MASFHTELACNQCWVVTCNKVTVVTNYFLVTSNCNELLFKIVIKYIINYFQDVKVTSLTKLLLVTFNPLCLVSLSNLRLALNEYCYVMHSTACALDILQAENKCFLGFLLPTLDSLQTKLKLLITDLQ